MIITKYGRFFWPNNIENINDEVISGKTIIMMETAKWKFWSWQLSIGDTMVSLNYD